MFLSFLLPLSVLVSPSIAAVTIYTNIPGVNAPLTTSTAPYAQSTGNSAYSSLVLTPPDPPGDLQTTVNVNLNPTGGMPGLSVPQRGNYLGFSVELSIADQIREFAYIPWRWAERGPSQRKTTADAHRPCPIVGRNSTFLNPIFLNYMANIKERIGMGPVVRVGGNTQDE